MDLKPKGVARKPHGLCEAHKFHRTPRRKPLDPNELRGRPPGPRPVSSAPRAKPEAVRVVRRVKPVARVFRCGGVSVCLNRKYALSCFLKTVESPSRFAHELLPGESLQKRRSGRQPSPPHGVSVRSCDSAVVEKLFVLTNSIPRWTSICCSKIGQQAFS